MQVSYQWGSFKCNLTVVKGYLVLGEGYVGGEKQNKNSLILRPTHSFSWMLLPFAKLLQQQQANTINACIKLNYRLI